MSSFWDDHKYLDTSFEDDGITLQLFPWLKNKPVDMHCIPLHVYLQ
jgi:hypothetical protein